MKTPTKKRMDEAIAVARSCGTMPVIVRRLSVIADIRAQSLWK
jgi:hypothetical protein